MTVWSPLAGGFLSGKYTRENLVAKENRLSGIHFIPFDKEAEFRIVEEMRQVSQSVGATVAQIAISWLLAKSYVTSVIIGASKLCQLDDNLKSVDVQLGEAELAKLDALTAPQTSYPNWFTELTTDPQHKRTLGPT